VNTPSGFRKYPAGVYSEVFRNCYCLYSLPSACGNSERRISLFIVMRERRSYQPGQAASYQGRGEPAPAGVPAACNPLRERVAGRALR
jgi:hypothetical protein